MFLFRTLVCSLSMISKCFFFQAEDGIRYLVRSRGLGDVYKRQVEGSGTIVPVRLNARL